MKLSLPETVWMATEPVNLRLSFDRLAGYVRQDLGEDLNGPVMVLFYNKRRTHVKLLWHNGRGYCIYYARLDRGTFRLRTVRGERKLLVDVAELERILQGARQTRIEELKREVAEARASREELERELRSKGWLGDRKK